MAAVRSAVVSTTISEARSSKQVLSEEIYSSRLADQAYSFFRARILESSARQRNTINGATQIRQTPKPAMNARVSEYATHGTLFIASAPNRFQRLLFVEATAGSHFSFGKNFLPERVVFVLDCVLFSVHVADVSAVPPRAEQLNDYHADDDCEDGASQEKLRTKKRCVLVEFRGKLCKVRATPGSVILGLPGLTSLFANIKHDKFKRVL